MRTGTAGCSAKRLILVIAVILGWVSTTWAAASGSLTTLRAVHALSNAEASHLVQAEFEATVTYYLADERTLFLQDGDAGIFVWYPNEAKVVPGDRIRVVGKTHDSFNPIVVADQITLLRHGVMPKALPVNFDQMNRTQTDCLLVTVRGVVRSADLAFHAGVREPITTLRLLTDGGAFDVNMNSSNPSVLDGLVDSEAEVTGVAAQRFDSKMQATGIILHVPSLAGVKILKRSSTIPWSLPATPMDRVLSVYHVEDFTSRVRVHGAITYYQPGTAVVLQDGDRSIWINTRTMSPLQIGDIADATGFPNAQDGFLKLDDGEIRDTHVSAPVTPLPAIGKKLLPGTFANGHHDDLVSIEGRVVTQVREPAQDIYVLSADGKLFSAIFHHNEGPPPVVRHVPMGSMVRVTGICVIENSNPYFTKGSFDILLRSFDDITVVEQPSLVNTRNLILIVGLLLLLVAFVGAWGWNLERKVRQKTVALAVRIEEEAAHERRLAQLEQKRSGILEDINGSRPLAEILEEIAAMVSSSLEGAPCWCEIADGARLGDCPQEKDKMRIIRANISARSGLSLGTLFVGVDAGTPPIAREAAALNNGAKLATLAIETRRLYSDLLRRSEFDLLTDIHNRFSLETHLDACIEEARKSAGIFGLLYIDLDKFKQVNDLYSHHIGDLYLQEVARRMKQQLRSHDLLARLGGDEFAVLLPMVRNRSGVEEIAQRLEHCFDLPFELEGNKLQGSASIGIALYPENGATKDSLLNTADAAMYAVKNNKMQNEILLSQV